MADAYGTFAFTQSDDSIIDSEQLVHDLNRFRWDFSDGRWEWDEQSKKIFHDEYAAQYPTVFPEMIAEIELGLDEDDDDESAECCKAYDDMLEEDWENVADINYEEVDLIDIKRVLGKHITQGWIEISYSSQQKSHYASIGSIRIEAGGDATRRYVFWSSASGTDITEQKV
jgi:hypothetical protein